MRLVAAGDHLYCWHISPLDTAFPEDCMSNLIEADRLFFERAGLDRYAAPAPEDFGPYQTFCGT